MATIGSVIIALKTDYGDLVKGLKTAGQKLQDFGAQAAKWGGVAVAAAAGAVALITKNSADAIDTLGKLSDTIGASTEGLIGLQHAAGLAGIESETLSKGLIKLGVNLANAASGGGPAKDALNALGLSAQQLAGADRVEAFKQIADALNEVQNPAQKAALAVELFGKSGADMLPLLASGSSGIEEMTAEAEKLGLSFSRVQAAQVEEANDALTRIGEVFSGIGNQIAIGLAPYIQLAAEKFIALTTEGGALREVFTGAWELISTAILEVLDLVDLLSPAILAVGAVFAQVGSIAASVLGIFSSTFRVLGEQLGNMAGAMADLASTGTNLGGAIRNFGKEVAAANKANADAAAASANRARQSAAALDEDTKKVAASVGELTTKYEDQIKFFGLSARQAEVWKLALAGANQEAIANATALAQQLDELEARKKKMDDLGSFSDNLIRETMTPLEQYYEKIEKIQEAFAAGLISDEVFSRGIAKAKAELDKEDLGEKQFDRGDLKSNAAALELGSQEARSAILAFRQNTPGEGLPDIARTNRAQLEEARRQTEQLASINRSLIRSSDDSDYSIGA